MLIQLKSPGFLNFGQLARSHVRSSFRVNYWKLRMCLADFKKGLSFTPFTKNFKRTGKKKIKLSFY